MKYLNKIASVFCSVALGLLALTSCEGGDLYSVDAPDWISAKVDSINEANKGKGEEEIEGMHEDVYTVGATDFTTGWWAVFSKYYQVPDGEKWITQFNLNINPNASNTYKNFALIITNDEDRGAGNYKEYGAIRYDYQPSGNSEWGDYIDRSLASSTLTFETDTDPGVGNLGGKVTLTVDRTQGGMIVTMTNGKVTKTYNQSSPLAALNGDGSNSPIRCFLVPEGSYIDFLGSTIEPIGGYTSKEDKLPLSMTLNGVPKKVKLGTELAEAFANVTATIQFEQGVTKDVPASELSFQAVPDMNSLGTKTLMAAYNKSYKGEVISKSVMAMASFDVVILQRSGALTLRTSKLDRKSRLSLASPTIQMVRITGTTSLWFCALRMVARSTPWYVPTTMAGATAMLPAHRVAVRATGGHGSRLWTELR